MIRSDQVRRALLRIYRMFFALTTPAVARVVGRFSGISSTGSGIPEIRRILVIRLDGIGDLVLSTPFLRELRVAFPDAQITLITSPETTALFRNCGRIDRVISFRWWKGLRPFARIIQSIVLFQKRLKSEHFDLAIAPRFGPDFLDAVYLAYFSKATWRIGYSEDARRRKYWVDRGKDRLLTHVLSANGPKHEVERGLDIIRFLGIEPISDSLELGLDPKAAEFAADALKVVCGSSGTRPLLVAIAAGANGNDRIWPRERFAEIARWLAGLDDTRILVMGGPLDADRANAIAAAAGHRAFSFAGKATISQTCSLLSHCDVCIGADTGLIHLAAATGVRTVVVSNHSLAGDPEHDRSPARFAPRGRGHIVVRPASQLEPCLDGCEQHEPHCILGVTVDQVKMAIRETLREISAASPATPSSI
jgi:lipopolysaccharide heptosyltransferase II